MPAAREDIVAELGKLAQLPDADCGRLLATVMALAGEVFVLKAQVERLTIALEAAGGVDAARLAAAEKTARMQQWLLGEEAAFTRSITEPYLKGDRSIDATRWMRAE